MRDSERIFKVIIVTKNYGCAMSEVIGCQPVNLEAQVWSQASTGELCSRQSGSGTGSSTTTSVFPVFLPVRQFHLSVSFDQCSILIHSYTYHPYHIMFFSRYFNFPCQYHSTNAPYTFIHLLPMLYKVFPPSTSVSPVSIIPPMRLIHSSTTYAV